LSKLYSYGYYEGKNPSNHLLSEGELKTLSIKVLKSELDLLLKLNYRILYYGPFSEAELSSALSQGVQASLTPKTPASPVKSQDYVLRKVQTPQAIMVNFDKVQTDIIWLYNGLDFKPELLPVITLYNEYFGAGMSSVVFQEIRESKALAYSTYSRYSTPSDKKYPFRFAAYIGCQADKLNESVDAMQALLDKMPKSNAKFLAAKSSLKFNISSSRITGENVLYEYLRSEKLGMSVPVNQYVVDKMDVLTYADIEKFQQTHISSSPKTLIIFGDFSKLKKEEISKRFPEIRSVSADELFGY
jgi:predicted Zn-dependent peptidase